MLKVQNLHVSYGAIKAVRGIDFEIEQGQIVSLIGSNGAGKTTTLRTISGLLNSTEGKITFKGEDITKAKAKDIMKKGLVQVPEGRMIFPTLTVYENLLMGAYTRKDKEAIKNSLTLMFELFPILQERKNQNAGTLSGGEQQMLAMARALMAEPDLLMLDEPSMGLAPILVKQIFSIIQKINKKRNVTILLIEQNAKQALNICDKAYVLENGKIVLSGTGKELIESEEVKKAYLGG